MSAKQSNIKSTFRRRGTDEIRHFADKAFGQVCPVLHAWMTALWDDDGEVRDLVTVTFAVKDGRFKAMLSDPNMKEVCFVALERFDGCWSEIEKAIAEGKLEWIKKRQQHNQSSANTRNGMAPDRPGTYSENNNGRQ